MGILGSLGLLFIASSGGMYVPKHAFATHEEIVKEKTKEEKSYFSSLKARF